MKFRRNVHLFRGSLDAAPLATVFFLLVIFLLLGSRIYTPGVHIQLPSAENLSGTDKPTVIVAMDASGRLYFESQLIEKQELKSRLAAAAKTSREPLVLEVWADKAATQENLEGLLALARSIGIKEALLARLPRNIGEQPPTNPKSTTP